ncbi:MAG: hypothetical protein K2X99_05640 [Gemmatimonadaceae bacterium]|nr:hypothetical protein [Gemmatimonadaceae bacterium]
MSAFASAGWQVEADDRGSNHPHANLLLRQNARCYVAEVKAIARGSSIPLEDAWSRVCLEVRQAIRNDELPLAIVVAPRISRSAVARLENFRERYAPDVAMGAIDHLGLQVFRGSGLEALNREPKSSLPGEQQSHSLAHKNLFSDLNQWLLKVLLAAELPERLLSAPRGEFRNATALAEAAGCSIMSAHRFVEELRREGFLGEERRHLHLVRRGALFRRWKSVPSHSIPDAPFKIIGHQAVRSAIASLFPPNRACLGLFAAANEMGLGFVSGVPPYVLVDRPSVLPGGSDAASESRSLLRARPGEATHMVVRIPKAPRSVYRGLVRPKGVACADVIQTWLDTSEHSARGEEQAQLIWREHLAPIAGALPDD